MKTVSVIIPTRGRDRCLREALTDFDRQTFRDFDVWISDQNDIPLVDLKSSISSIDLHHEKMKPLGSHAGRNHAIYKSNSKYFVFVDDDVRVASDFLQKHVDALKSADEKTAIIAGRVVQPKDELSEDDMKAQGKFARYSAFTGLVSGNFIGSEKGFVDHFHECNFSVKAEVLKKVGAFNTAFEGNAYFEGTDVALRLLNDGFKIFYNPEISLIHLQDGSGGNRVGEKAKHTYWMLRNQTLLNSNHMNRLGLPIFLSYGIYYSLGKSLKNKDPMIAVQGVRGLADGLKYFFNKKGNKK